MIPVLAAPALAVPPQTLTVGVYDQYPSVSDALDYANDGDTIEVHGPGGFAESLDLFDRTLDFVAADGAVLLPIDPSTGWAWVHGASVVTVTGFDIDGQNSTRAFRVSDSASLTVSGGQVHDTVSAMEPGGAFLVTDTAHLELLGVDLAVSSAVVATGGFVQVDPLASLHADGSTFSIGNAVGAGGALSCGGECTILNCVFDQNHAGGAGGAIVADSPLWVFGSRFCRNDGSFGGAIFGAGDGDYVQYSVFGLNVATTSGGAIYGLADLTAFHNDFLANEGGAGGAAFQLAPGALFSSHEDLFVDHADGTAVIAASGATVDLAYDLFYDNNLLPDIDSGGSGTGAVHADPMLTSWDGIDCAAAVLTLDPGSYAIDAGDPADPDADGSPGDIGAFGPVGAVCVPTTESAGDGVDSDCDGLELCYQDADDDGFGEEYTETLADFPCAPPYYANADDVCANFDDAIDTDGDGLPDDCDPEPGTTTSWPGTTGSEGDADADADSDADVDADTDTDGDGGTGKGGGGGGLVRVGSQQTSLSGGVCGCAGSGGSAVPWAGLAVLGVVVRRRT